MKIIFYLLIISNLFSQNVFSQKDSSLLFPNLVYIEAGGIGGYGSINYERNILSIRKILLGARVGISTYNFKDYTNSINPDILLLTSINGSYGYKHKIEIAIGETTSNIVYADKTNFSPTRKTNFHTNFSLGYKYQKNTYGLFFRLAYTPLIELNTFFRNWGGVSFGYKF